MTDRPVLSASSLTSYLRCPKMYYYSNVLRLPGAQNLAALLGQSVHAAVETLWKSPKRPETALERTFSAGLPGVPPPYDEPPEAVLDDAKRLYITYVQKVAPTFTPTLVEEKFVVDVEGTLLSGTIDAADEDVHDLKTVSMISKFDPARYALQLNLYALGYRMLTGLRPRRLLLDVLPRRGNITYRQVEIKQETGDLMDAVGLVTDGIMRGEYAPTGALNGSCRFCEYKRVCPDAIE